MCTNKEKDVSNEAILLKWVVFKHLVRIHSYKNAMGLCTISCETTMRESNNFNWPVWRNKEENQLVWWFYDFLFGTFARLFRAIGVFWVMKSLEDE